MRVAADRQRPPFAGVEDRRPAAGAAVLAALLALAGCQAESEEAKRPDPVVRVATVDLVSLARTTTYTGIVKPRIEVAESFRVAGKVTERRVDVGDTVQAGETIARLDTVDLDLAVEQAQATLAAARSNLARTTADEERSKQLLSRGHATQADYDGKKLALDEAEARLENAEKSLTLAENQRAYAELKASGDGVVRAVAVEAGQVVALGTPVVTIARLGEREVLVAIPESRLADLDGAEASVTLWADDRAFPAKLREISPDADPATRTYAARFSIPAADATVRFGMTATLTLSNGEPAQVARVPSTAILDEGRGPTVFTVDPSTSKLAKVPVEVGRYESADVVVTAGLKPGDRVVTLGVNRLEDGEAVRVAVAN